MVALEKNDVMELSTMDKPEETKNGDLILTIKSNLNSTPQQLQEVTTQPSENPDSKKRIWINLFIISFGLTGLTTSYDMLRYVESSLNSEEGLGTASLACIYAMIFICALFLPTFFIQRFGCKRTFLIAVTCAFVYFCSHFYPSYYTLLPGGLFMGFAYGLARTSANTMVTDLAISYSQATKKATSDCINLFFGIFILLTFTARIWGNLTQSEILNEDSNITANHHLDICGSSYCWQNLKSNEDDPQETLHLEVLNDDPNSSISRQAYILYGITIIVGIITLIIVGIFMDDRRTINNEEIEQKNLLRQAAATLALIKEPQMLLMIPITFTLGLIESYMSSDFTKAFVTCSLGIHHVGFVIICYGCTASLSSYLWGWLANKLGRLIVILIGTTINVATIFVMLYWHPDPNHPVVYYLLSGSWGLSDAVWRSQLFAMYGYIFYTKKEAGFANFEVWESIGLVTGYVYHDLICITVKLLIIFGMLMFGVACYLVVEIMIWLAKKKGLVLSTAFRP